MGAGGMIEIIILAEWFRKMERVGVSKKGTAILSSPLETKKYVQC